MTKAFDARLTKLEALGGLELSERAKAWLGWRRPLTVDEEAADPEADQLDVSRMSAELIEWLEGSRS